MDGQLLLGPRGFTLKMHSMKIKFTRYLIVLSAALAALVGHPDTALAQNVIAFSPNAVFLTYSAANNTGTTSTTVTVTDNAQPAKALTGTAVFAAGVPNFLSVIPTINGNQSFLTLIANSAGLQPGTYNATVNVVADGQTAALPVTLTFYSANTLTLSSNALTFSGPTGGAAPASQTVSVTGTVPGIPFTVSVATATGGNWLSAAQTGTAVPASIVVSANPGSLTAGTYTGTVTVSSDQIQPQVITVTLVVSGQPVLVVSPNPVALLYQTGVGAPAPTATVQVLSTVTSLSYTGAVSYTSCGNFFSVTSGLSGITNTTMVVTANLTIIGMATNCAGTITLTAPGSTVTIPVTFQASTLPLISVNPPSATFNYSVGGTLPAGQTFTVSSSTSAVIPYGVSATVPWLALPITPGGGFTTNTFTASLNAAALTAMNPGTYQGTIFITALGASNSPLSIPVTLTISNNPLVTITPGFLTFNYQTGTPIPSALSVNLASTMGSVPFTISVPTTTSTQFVAFTPASGTATTTAQPLSISLVPTTLVGLAPGVYTNQVQVSASGVTQLLNVTLNVSTSPLVNVSPQQLVFTYASGAVAPPQQTLTISSTNGAALPVAFTSNQSYLLVAGGTATTPSSVNIAVIGGLAVGTYNAQITVISGAQTQIVPVTINVTSGISISATPASLSFSQSVGGAAPAAQTVTVASTNSAALAYSVTGTTSTGANWLMVNGSTGVFQGSAPGTFSVAVNGSTLAAGTYTGSVVITSVGSTTPTITIPVTLTVVAQTLAAAPSSLTFGATAQGAVPASQTINVTSTTGSPVAFTATAAATGGSWLTVTPAVGTTTQAVTVSVNQAGLAAGTYTGSVTFTSTAAGSVGLVIPVTFVVSAQAAPVLSQVVNAASGAPGAVSPGELISLFGTNLGPVTPGLLTLTAQGSVGTTLSGVQVMFNGNPAPLIYVSATQINAVVPYEVSGLATTSVVVTFNGVAAAALQLNVVAAAPGIFFFPNGTQAAALNQNGSGNGTASPAAKGSTIVLYATGEGQTNPLGVTGSVTGATLKKPTAAVSVTVGGLPATVAYAGSAPGLVSGVLQLNVIVPTGVASGVVPVVLTIGGVATQQNVTVAIQ